MLFPDAALLRVFLETPNNHNDNVHPERKVHEGTKCDCMKKLVYTGYAV